MADRVTETVRAGDRLEKNIRSWLSPPDPWKNHNLARGSRHTGTTAWFVGGSTLSEWKSSGSSSLLWVHGKRKPSSSHALAGTDRFSLDSRRGKEYPIVR